MRTWSYNAHNTRNFVLNKFAICLTDANQIFGASFDFAVVDSNSLMFVFKHSPEVVKELHGNQELSFDTVIQSDFETWKVLSNLYVFPNLI